jgi:hypothetical protein
MGHQMGHFVRPQIHPIYAAAGALLLFGALQATIVPLAVVGHVSTVVNGQFNIYALLIALIDWVACVASIFLGMKLTRREPVMVASFLATVLSIWHLGMIFALFHFAQTLEDNIVPYLVVAFGGLIVTGAVLVMGYERRTAVSSGSLANRKALEDLARQSVYGQALSTAGLSGSQGDTSANTSKFNDAGKQNETGRSHVLPRTLSLTEAEERSASFFDLDLIMLEAELFKISPNHQAYISALRLGIAIEKDMGFVNCRARTFTFSELMKDVCTRLSSGHSEAIEQSFESRNLEGSQWPTMAESFGTYASSDRLVRRKIIASLEDAIVAAQLLAARRSERPAGDDLEGDCPDDINPLSELEEKILATIK